MEENKGTIAYLGNGFGFIKIEGRAKDLFFHAQELENVGFEELQVNDSVVFDSIASGFKGDAAQGVRKV
jgi:cold shock CspA family protein